MRGLYWGAIAALAVFPGCQTTGEGDVSKAWRWGMYRLPANSVREGKFQGLEEIRTAPASWQVMARDTTLKPGVKVPAVIYLHGCAGNTGGSMWAQKFNEMGYAFFAPDSLSRPRRSQCGVGQMQTRIWMRLEEMRYALAEIGKADWIDQKRLILMGSSEGAHAASDYAGRDFAAVVLIGADCRHSGGSPNVPAGIPVLNMVGSRDKDGGGFGCSIDRSVGGSKKIIIEKVGHKLYGNQDAHRHLERFLAACCA